MKVTDLVVASALALFALACASCVRIERREYPKDWSHVPDAAGTCPDLTGDYANRDQGDTPELLTKWILPKTTYPLERIERVRMAGPKNGNVTVRLMEGPSTEVAVREWKQDAEYRCENGWLVLQLESFVLPLPAVGYSVEARLARNVDGRLVVETTETGGGVVVFVPGYSNVRKWHLYPVAAE